jgi:hypothetical protein
MTDTEVLELCPPHNFRAGWATNDSGRIYCSLCGEVRLLEPALTEAPSTEVIHARKEDTRPNEGGGSGPRSGDGSPGRK